MMGKINIAQHVRLLHNMGDCCITWEMLYRYLVIGHAAAIEVLFQLLQVMAQPDLQCHIQISRADICIEMLIMPD